MGDRWSTVLEFNPGQLGQAIPTWMGVMSTSDDQAPVTSVLLYAAETWTVLASDLKTLEAFHMKCQREILQVNWQQFIRNEEITAITGLPSMSDIISRRRNAVFGHIARLDTTVPAHQALHAHVNLSLG